MDEHLKIFCGDWIYPSRNSSTGVTYPVDTPLVAEIFLPNERGGKDVSKSSLIIEHLHGPRFLDVHISNENVMAILSLRSKAEKMFLKEINQDIPFDPATLARERSLWQNGKYEGRMIKKVKRKDYEWNAIFFTSILLQAYLGGVELPEGILFRNATIPEIEALGGW